MAKREKLIQIRTTDEEYEIIAKNAEKSKKQVAAYIRSVALNPVIIQIDYKKIAEHTKEIAEVRNSVNRLIFTIEASNNYLPREIQSIVELMENIFKSENKLLQELRKERKNISKPSSIK